MAIQRSSLFLAAAGGLILASAVSKAATLEPQVEIDRPVITTERTETIHVIVRFDVPESDRAGQRRPDVNLALVLDRSGSMDAHGKIRYLKTAAHSVIDRLRVSDRLAVVEYDDRITLMWPSGPVEGKRSLKRLIDELFPRGATNLAGGMQRGVDEIAEYARRYDVTRVLLLSDGLANRGVVAPHAIRRMAKDARHAGVRVTTLGLGVDYNEDLMQDIAQASGGNYYYIETPAQMARIFERELQTLFETVAKDVEMIYTPAGPVRGIRVLGHRQERSDSAIRLPMEDFHAGEQRSVVLALEVEPERLGELDLGQIRFSYRDMRTGEKRHARRDLSIEVTRDLDRARAAINREADVEATLATAEEEHRQSLTLYEQGRIKEAQEKVDALRQRLGERNELLKDERLDAKLEAFTVEQKQMEDSAAAPAAKSDFLKKSKQRLYQANKGNRALYSLKKGDKGFEVERLQRALKTKGYYNGPIDGEYDQDVDDAVRDMQRKNNMEEGAAGAKAMDFLGLY